MKTKLYVGNLSFETTEIELLNCSARQVRLKPSKSSRTVKQAN